MAYTAINSQDRLVQTTFAEHLEKVLGWDSVYAWNRENLGAAGTLGRTDPRKAVLILTHPKPSIASALKCLGRILENLRRPRLLFLLNGVICWF